MAKQHHDQGWKKRQPREQAPGALPSMESLAAKLVRAGLRSPVILDYNHPKPPERNNS